ncbi:MAG: hypothetical protein QM775_30820 [Pirellulales bacterium]
MANSLSFDSGYTLTGGDIDLSSGRVTVNVGSYARIDSLLTQDSGLTLAGTLSLGRGGLRITNAANSYTGTTTVAAGTLIATSAGALGTDASAIVVSGSQTAGANGGTLLLTSDYGSTFTLARGLSLVGWGPFASNPNSTTTINPGAAFISVGNTSISGQVTTATGSINTGIVSSFGTLTFGNLQLSGSGSAGARRSARRAASAITSSAAC